MRDLVQRFVKDSSGATSIEYALIAGLLSVVIIGTIHAMSASLLAIFATVNTGLAH